MLYLMMDKRESQYFVKVGVTRDLDKRRSQYRLHNPTAIMRSSCRGTESDETFCHTLLAKNGKHYQGEWYLVNKDFFNNLYKKGMEVFYPKKAFSIYLQEKFPNE